MTSYSIGLAALGYQKYLLDHDFEATFLPYHLSQHPFGEFGDLTIHSDA